MGSKYRRLYLLLTTVFIHVCDGGGVLWSSESLKGGLVFNRLWLSSQTLTPHSFFSSDQIKMSLFSIPVSFFTLWIAKVLLRHYLSNSFRRACTSQVSCMNLPTGLASQFGEKRISLYIWNICLHWDFQITSQKNLIISLMSLGGREAGEKGDSISARSGANEFFHTEVALPILYKLLLVGGEAVQENTFSVPK